MIEDMRRRTKAHGHGHVNAAGRAQRVRLNLLHRLAAAGFGVGLWVFAILGLVNRLDMFSTRGVSVLGLSSNGLLSVISLVVGGVLIAAAALLVVVGSAFLLSGLANVLVLDTRLNLLAFTITNVVFSLVSGALLLFLGAYGRFSGGLSDDNPYQQERHGDEQGERMPTIYAEAGDIRAVSELAEAERAAARHGASSAQAAGLAAIHDIRTAEDRVRGGRSATHEEDRADDPAG